MSSNKVKEEEEEEEVEEEVKEEEEEEDRMTRQRRFQLTEVTGRHRSKHERQRWVLIPIQQG